MSGWNRDGTSYRGVQRKIRDLEWRIQIIMIKSLDVVGFTLTGSLDGVMKYSGKTEISIEKKKSGTNVVWPV
jgi:hypothetical protein